MIDPSGMMHTAAIPMGLADQLKTRTEALHREAERSGIIQDLLRGRGGRPAYALLLRNLLPAYEALEAALERLEPHAPARLVARPEMYRGMALRSDLADLAGASWQSALPVLPSGRRYGERVAAAAAGDGTGLIAHAYVRYLGDLNGGQILRRLLARHLGLGAGSLAFYDFPALADPSAAGAALRAGLDDLVLPAETAAALIEEAANAFRLNIELSNEVGRHALAGEAPTLGDLQV